MQQAKLQDDGAARPRRLDMSRQDISRNVNPFRGFLRSARHTQGSLIVCLGIGDNHAEELRHMPVSRSGERSYAILLPAALV